MVQHADLDHTGLTGVGGAIDWGETGDITDQDYDDVADAGVLNEVARADHLHGMPSAGGSSPTAAAVVATVATDQSTTSTSYTDLATTGPAVTVTVNTIVQVTVGCNMFGSGGQGRMSWVGSGANTIAVADHQSYGSLITNADSSGSRSVVLTGLTPGSTTFTAKYKALAAGTIHFQLREISVIPLD